MRKFLEIWKNPVVIFGFFAVSFVILAIIGSIRGYSPVPFWDSLGVSEVFLTIQNGDLSIWWAQHNEHRMLLERIFFWIEFYFFNGNLIFLFVLNEVLMGLIATCFFFILKIAFPHPEDKKTRLILFFLIVVLSFSWMQMNNIIWDFQASFFLASLFPLFAFYLLGLSVHRESHSTLLFYGACLAGIASAGTMANGVLALPLMVILALFLKMSRNKIILLCAFSAVILFYYFFQYVAPPHHGSLKDALLHNPINFFYYILVYLGSPFYYMTGKGSHFLATLGGAFFVGSICFFAYDAFKKRDKWSVAPVLIIFLFYIGLTACGTSGGRSAWGISQALTSRYTTPILTGWSALLILYALWVQGRILQNQRSVFLWGLVPLLLLPQQLKVFRSGDNHCLKHELKIAGNNHLYERKIAALALELDVKDKEQIWLIFPHVDKASSIVARAKEKNLSIFGHPLIKNVRKLIGQPSNLSSAPLGLGNIDSVRPLEEEARYVRIQGWLWDKTTKSPPQKIHIIDQHNQVVGYAFTGQVRPDLKSVNRRAKCSGFKGYLLAQNVEESVTLRGLSPDCQVVVSVPPLPPKVEQPNE